MTLMLALALIGCGSMPVDAPDSASPVDGGADVPDASELDSGGVADDAGTDASVESDARVERDARIEVDGSPLRDSGATDGGAVCSLVLQTGCGPSQACRRDPGDGSMIPPTGAPRCEPAGTMYEWGWPDPSRRCRSDGEDLCVAGLFCLALGQCARFCDPSGAPCPDTPDGTTQRCVTDPAYAPDPFCSPF